MPASCALSRLAKLAYLPSVVLSRGFIDQFDIQSKKIRKTRRQYKIDRIEAVFKNRYSVTGELKSGIKNSNTTSVTSQ